MTVSHEAPPSDKQDAEIPTQNSHGSQIMGKVLELAIPTQEQRTINPQFRIDPELFLSKANANINRDNVVGSQILLLALEEEGIVPSQQLLVQNTLRLEALEKAFEISLLKPTENRLKKYEELKKVAGVIGEITAETIEQSRLQEAQARAKREAVSADLQSLQRGFDEAYLKRDKDNQLTSNVDLGKNLDLIKITQPYVEKDDLLKFSSSLSEFAKDDKERMIALSLDRFARYMFVITKLMPNKLDESY